jgi:hypothetical protein
MLMPSMSRGQCSAVILALMAALFTSVPARSGTAAKPVLRFESSPSGEYGLIARGVTIRQALAALAERAGFEVLMDEGVKRPLVNLTIPIVPIEDLLHEILRGRNYSLVYDEESASLSQVILLAPSTPGRARPARPPARKAAAGARRPAAAKKAPAPVVIRN